MTEGGGSSGNSNTGLGALGGPGPRGDQLGGREETELLLYPEEVILFFSLFFFHTICLIMFFSSNSYHILPISLLTEVGCSPPPGKKPHKNEN